MWILKMGTCELSNPLMFINQPDLLQYEEIPVYCFVNYCV